jgi:PAS domain S-box-containing protein
MNKMLSEMTGFSEEELKGASMRRLYGDDATYEAVEEKLGKQILKEGRGSVETEWIKKDGRKIFVLFAATKVREKIKDEEITFTALDITERKHSYDRLIQSEKMMTVGGLAAGMAHEINNPLGIIMQGIQMIQKRLDLENSENITIAGKLGLDMMQLHDYMEGRKVLEYINNIRDAVIRAANIVSNMLQFSRKGETKVSDVDLNELIDRSIDIVSKDYDLEKKYDFRSIKIVKKYDRSLKKISCFETEIEQVFLNLLKNSAQSMSEENRYNRRPVIEIITRMEKSFAVVDVIDNGPGMRKEILNRIFEPFYTTKKVGAGTGLGLSVSYFIITNNHSGSIAADSEPGKGARFTIKLPVTDA